jgi:hypothetical protein
MSTTIPQNECMSQYVLIQMYVLCASDFECFNYNVSWIIVCVIVMPFCTFVFDHYSTVHLIITILYVEITQQLHFSLNEYGLHKMKIPVFVY